MADEYCRCSTCNCTVRIPERGMTKNGVCAYCREGKHETSGARAS